MLAKKGLLKTFQDLRQSERESLFVHLMEGLIQIRLILREPPFSAKMKK